MTYINQNYSTLYLAWIKIYTTYWQQKPRIYIECFSQKNHAEKYLQQEKDKLESKTKDKEAEPIGFNCYSSGIDEVPYAYKRLDCASKFVLGIQTWFLSIHIITIVDGCLPKKFLATIEQESAKQLLHNVESNAEYKECIKEMIVISKPVKTVPSKEQELLRAIKEKGHSLLQRLVNVELNEEQENGDRHKTKDAKTRELLYQENVTNLQNLGICMFSQRINIHFGEYYPRSNDLENSFEEGSIEEPSEEPKEMVNVVTSPKIKEEIQHNKGSDNQFEEEIKKRAKFVKKTAKKKEKQSNKEPEITSEEGENKKFKKKFKAKINKQNKTNYCFLSSNEDSSEKAEEIEIKSDVGDLSSKRLKESELNYTKDKTHKKRKVICLI